MLYRNRPIRTQALIHWNVCCIPLALEMDNSLLDRVLPLILGAPRVCSHAAYASSFYHDSQYKSAHCHSRHSSMEHSSIYTSKHEMVYAQRCADIQFETLASMIGIVYLLMLSILLRLRLRIQLYRQNKACHIRYINKMHTTFALHQEDVPWPLYH